MITPQLYAQFQAEVAALLQKYSVGTYLISLVVHDAGGDLSDIPSMYNVTGIRELKIPATKLSGVFAENTLGVLLRMLVHFNGLALHQAVGALTESLNAAAHQLEQAQEAHEKQQELAARQQGETEA